MKSLISMTVIGAGLGVSAFLLTRQWIPIFIWGVFVGFVLPYVTSRYEAEPEHTPVPAHLKPAAPKPGTYYGIAALLGVIGVFCLGYIYTQPMLFSAYPALASGMLFTIASIFGCALFVMSIARKETRH